MKSGVEQIINRENTGVLVSNAHRAWDRELFQPSVTVGLIGAEALAGYHDNPVYIKKLAACAASV